MKGSLSATDWKAINWYADQYGYTIRDMFAVPMIRFRTVNDNVIDINIMTIRSAYKKQKERKIRA